MRAVHIREYGGPHTLEIIEVPPPVCGPDEVRFAVAAAGINRKDLNQRQGRYGSPRSRPEIPGLEVSGHVLEVGRNANARFEAGEAVVALLSGCGYAEQVVAPSGQVLPAPTGVALTEAAGLPEAAATVFHNLIEVAAVRPAETVLVHGAAGGIGTTAIQFLKAVGAQVAVTAGSAAKLDLAASLGAAILINYHTQDFAVEVKNATGGRGADLVLDIVGGPYLNANVDALCIGGRVVVIGVQGGREGLLDLRGLMNKRACVSSTALRDLDPEEKTRIMRGVQDQIWPLIDSAELRPIVDSTFALADAAAAHAYLETSSHMGKVLLIP